MRLRRLLPVLACAISFAAACQSPCVELSEKICECQYPEGYLRDQCEAGIAAEANLLEITPEDERVCESLIDKCNCAQLSTPEGKKACGYAR